MTHSIFSIGFAVPDLADAIKMEETAFKSRFGFDKPCLDSPIVTSCKIGGRAAKAAELLTGAGFTNVRIYSGSFNDWIAKNGPIEK